MADIGAKARSVLSQPVSIQSLAVFRILFGAVMVWDVLRFVQHDRIRRYWVEPDFHFTFAGFGWVRPLDEPWIHLAWWMVGVFALMIALGLFYRVAIVGFTLLFSYFFLLDKAQYLNHFYMVILFAALLSVMPAHRAYSLDAWARPRLRRETVAYASVFALRAQLEIILIFAGLVKLTPDWLRGEPLGMWLRTPANEPLFGWLLAQDWAILAGAWGAVALHLVGAPLLLWRRTRLATFLVYCAFHVANAYFFNIGIFPWLTVAATLVFFEPDWPRRFARWLLARFERPPPPVEEPAPVTASRRLPPLAFAAIVLWLIAQIAIPLRFAAFETETRWTGDGHRFAWRMRLYDRHAEGVFVVRDPESGRSWIVDPESFLTRRQARIMMPRPDMVHQFAGRLAELWRRQGYAGVEVYAAIDKSLNGRPAQPFVDPGVDLARAPLNRFGADAWVLPLTVELRTAAAE